MTIYLIFWVAALAIASFIKSNWMQIAFCVLVFVFVGLRYETGFDWPVYKRTFEVMAVDFSVDGILAYSQTFKVELGWLVVNGITGMIFPEYEFLQAIVALVFLVSTYKLCRALGVQNVAMAVAIASTYLLLTLLFSTTRQCFAVSIFNFAVVAAVNRRWTLMVMLSTFALSIHISTILYIVALVYALVRPSKLPRPTVVAAMSIVIIGLILAIPFAASYLPDHLASRVIWYGLDKSFENIRLWQIYFLILGAFIAGYALLAGPADQTPDTVSTFHRRIIVALAVMCLCTYSLDVVRDRISYEMFLIFSIYLARSNIPFRLAARSTAVALGLSFSLLNIFEPANRIVFMPYQSAVTVVLTGDEGDGQARQELLHREFERR